MQLPQSKTAIIIGAGPAGLTLAYELLTRTEIKPIILEVGTQVGGIAKSIYYKGNIFDLGGHRFFSKSSRVMAWWQEILPLEHTEDESVTISYQGQQTELQPYMRSDRGDHNVLLIRKRKSSIFFSRMFFDYPLSLTFTTLRKFGFRKAGKVCCSYLYSTLFPISPETTLEHFFINRFGNELYKTFFKSYTEKVWGVSCEEISAAWGAQRVKSLSVRKVLGNYLWSFVDRLSKGGDLERQKKKATSLIEYFLYPKCGPGHMWERVAELIIEKGGTIILGAKVDKILNDQNHIAAVEYADQKSGARQILAGEYFFSTMPIPSMVAALNRELPSKVKEVIEGLQFRNFLTVSLVVKKLLVTNKDGTPLKDNWIYIQESDVKIGRLQIYNNWSPAMVKDLDTICLGLEYFCSEQDQLWQMTDQELIDLGITELSALGIIEKNAVLDAHVEKVPKAYPAYTGTYSRMKEVQDYMNTFENLFLIGRNGMHRYNNQDHSMLTAFLAVDALVAGSISKEALWNVNTESDNHEE